ncbi:MAG: thioredoxin family protein [Acidobacteria bacterium]|nr:thioredoxin family protein [Acidobacteriota bacterium]
MSFIDRLVPSIDRAGRPLVAMLAFTLAVATAGQAQNPPPGSLEGFEPSGEFLFTIDGVEQPKAEIYQSQRAAALLVRCPALESPLLISPRSGSFAQVPIMNLALRDNGTADILGGEPAPSGTYTFDGEDVILTLDGHEMRIKPRPPLLGLHEGSDLLSYNPAYVSTAGEYEPDQASLDALRGTKSAVRVRVFFGSWCSFCKRYVPRLLKVQQSLGKTPITFEYYGLPHDFTSEPQAKANGIHGVPTGIVYVDGKEVGRLERASWSRPEVALRGLLGI